MPYVNGVAADQLRTIVERIERLQDERDVFGCMKSKSEFCVDVMMSTYGRSLRVNNRSKKLCSWALSCDYSIMREVSFAAVGCGSEWSCGQFSNFFHDSPSAIGEVYFLRQKTDGLIKIGFSKNPIMRKRNLECIIGQYLEFLGSIKSWMLMEWALQQCFSDWRVAGEWFDPDFLVSGTSNFDSFMSKIAAPTSQKAAA